ncbi:DUF3822 family protein [Segetibacter sp. 3557_3]|uniref:DUF3822 family protein n=1 Tax=Segetibacter sp. 3557_3 TaxID=2547429 RepID=UPI001058DC1C|nr:DUF3822 family protein [Segetibacter sp. 3557_3]TDH29179.1 DUF3822 family protein [Segetibacter sp. 3557_3]
MANKIFSIYSPQSPGEVYDDDQLILEIADTHIACQVKSSKSRTIASFELFKIAKSTKFLRGVLADILPHSKILQERYVKTKVFVQNARSVLVPAPLFNKNKAADYLTATSQPQGNVIVRHEHVDTFGGIVNVYSLPNSSENDFPETLGEIEIHHTYSQIIRSFPNDLPASNAVFKVQFYGNHFIVAVASNGVLKLVQSYQYQVPADVLYYLLNITELVNADVQTLKLEISGMIDLNSPLYKEVEKYFRNVVVEEADSRLIHLDASEYPMHYFTPIFNLAL